MSLVATPARAAHELLQLFVTQPYLELHTGPGRGYPVTQVVARGESVDVLYPPHRLVQGAHRARHGRLGLGARADADHDGRRHAIPVQPRRPCRLRSHRWESGVFAGAYSGATLISAYSALSITDNLKVEVGASQYLGNVSNGYLADIGLAHVFMPEWRFSPLVDLGTGYRWVSTQGDLRAAGGSQR